MADGCPDDEDLLPLAVNETPDEAVAAHVAACETCRERVEALRTELSTVRMLADDPVASGALAAIDASLAGVPPAVGRYFVVGRVAADDRTTTYRALHAALHAEVLLHCARHPVPEAAQAEEPLLAECARVAALRHPHVVPLRDAGIDAGRPFVVADAAAGTSLDRLAAAGPVDASVAVRWVGEIASALAAAHAQGVVHGAVEAAQIVAGDDGAARLGGFGLRTLRTMAARVGDQTPASRRESVSRDDEPTDAVQDVVDLGRVLVDLLAPPPLSSSGAERSPSNAARASVDDSAARLARAGVPKRLVDTCRRAVDRRAPDRFADAAAFAAALGQGPAKPSNRGAHVAIAVAVALLVGAIVWWAWR